jgi:hypothetical protein
MKSRRKSRVRVPMLLTGITRRNARLAIHTRNAEEPPVREVELPSVGLAKSPVLGSSSFPQRVETSASSLRGGIQRERLHVAVDGQLPVTVLRIRVSQAVVCIRGSPTAAPQQAPLQITASAIGRRRTADSISAVGVDHHSTTSSMLPTKANCSIGVLS